MKWGLILGIITIFALASFLIADSSAEKFNKNDCIAKIPKNVSSIVANKMKTDCRDKERRIIDNERYKNNPLGHEDTFDDNLSLVRYCDSNYSVYKTAGEKYFLKMSSFGYNQHCILLYKDDVWNYNGSDRNEVLRKKLDSLIETSMQKSVELKTKNPTLTKKELENKMDDFNKKIRELQEEAKRIQKQMEKMNSTKKTK